MVGKKFMLGLAVLGVITGLSSAASANSLQILNAPTVSGTGPFTYTYNVMLTPGNSIVTGDLFVLLDFNGYIAGSAVAAPNWIVGSTANNFLAPYSSVGVTPPDVIGVSTLGSLTTITHINPDLPSIKTASGFDDANITDLLFEYTGSGITAPGSGGAVSVGLFSADSTFHLFSLSGHSILGADQQNNGSPGANADPYYAPGDSALPTPLPASFTPGVLLLGGLVCAGAVRRRVKV